MRIENCVALLRAQLFGEPSISSFEAVKLTARTVRRGDLFVAFDKSEIPAALQNGAFGIVYDGEYDIVDTEIAWINVRDIKTAAFTLLRYALLKKKFTYIAMERIAFEIACRVAKDKRVYFLQPHDIVGLFENVLKSDEDLIVISWDGDFLQHLTSDTVETVFAPKESGFPLTSCQFFESNIIYYGEPLRVKLPSMWLKYLDGALDFLNSKGLENDIQQLSFLPFFDPVFVDCALTAKEFGRSEKAVIFAKFTEPHILKESIRYIVKEAKWAKKLFLLPINLSGFDDNEAIIMYYGSSEELEDILTANDFTYALVVDFDKTKLLKTKKDSATLFDFLDQEPDDESIVFI